MNEILTILKYRLGISTPHRDDYLRSIILGIVQEMKNIHGINIGTDDIPAEICMFVVDYAEFRYTNRGEAGGLPAHLSFRLKNLIISREKYEN